MFFGEHACNLDEKNRISIPVRFRAELGQDFILTRWFDHCIIVLPTEQISRIEEILADKGISKTKDINRFLYSGLAQVTPDKIGRVIVPPELRKHAGITKDAVVIGAGKYAEIWAPEEWEKKQQENMGEANVLEAMEELNI